MAIRQDARIQLLSGKELGLEVFDNNGAPPLQVRIRIRGETAVVNQDELRTLRGMADSFQEELDATN